jgi:hypothetical protein
MLDLTKYIPLDIAEKAVERALSDNEIQSVFFINHIGKEPANSAQDKILG